MITVHVNDTPIKIDDHFNVVELLEKIDSKIDGIAVAINNSIIFKDNWETQLFRDNDTVLIIQATQGG